MSEFCRECFLQEYPECKDDVLVMSTDYDKSDVCLCEGCVKVKPYVLFVGVRDEVGGYHKPHRGLRIQMPLYDNCAENRITDDMWEAIEKKF